MLLDPEKTCNSDSECENSDRDVVIETDRYNIEICTCCGALYVFRKEYDSRGKWCGESGYVYKPIGKVI